MRPIDADALNDAMYHEAFEVDSELQMWNSGCWIRYKLFEKCLENTPTIDAADRPQGEWIDAEIPLESGGSMPIQVCNLCKTFYPLAYTGGGHRFCPNCGARMKGADDE